MSGASATFNATVIVNSKRARARDKKKYRTCTSALTMISFSSAHFSSAVSRFLACLTFSRIQQGETAMDIALRKGYVEVQEIIANPPPIKPRNTNGNHIKYGDACHKKRDKNGSSGSRTGTDSIELKKKTKVCGGTRTTRAA